MSNPLIAQVVLGIYAVLLIAGGLIGYFKAGSRPSLIAGTASGLLAFVALGMSNWGLLGFRVGAFLALAMMVVFDVRLYKTRKFMPSGLLALMSVVVLVVLAFRIF